MKQHQFRKKDYNSLLRDKAVVEEIMGLEEIRRAAGGGSSGGLEAMESVDLEEVLERPAEPGMPTGLEAIVLRTGRPVLLIQNDTYEEPRLNTLRERLAGHRTEINSAIPKVGRVELLNSPDYCYIGTAWLIDEGVLITNRHVASFFARKRLGEYVIKLNPSFEPYDVKVDFKEEYQQAGDPNLVRAVIKVLHIEPDNGSAPDMAFLSISSEGLPDPLELADHKVRDKDFVAVIGYPAYDSRNDAADMKRIFKGIYNVKRLSPGMISEVNSDWPYFTHDCTSSGGNSGSPVVDLKTGKAIGLHFAGRYLDANYAVRSELIKSRLADLSSRNFRTGVAVPAEVEEEAVEASQLADRTGYDPNFLDTEVPHPGRGPALEGKVATLIDSEEEELRYQHFSILMHAERKMALYTVSNIDGNKMYAFRRGRDKWYSDPRMDEQFQALQPLYTKNDFHRGHLVRRLDPVWGDTRVEAKKGMEDTFFWTNCTPQHKRFNPVSWLGLEDYILDNADTKDLKVTLFTGPIFKDTDQEYRDHLIPEEYWKVAVVDNERTGKLSATAYLLSQKEFIGDMEFVFGEYETYQVALSRIEDDTGLQFGLSEFDPMAANESVIRTINNEFDIEL